jgi:ketosteroid isomerase-like protein
MPPDRDAEIVRRLRAGYDAFNRGDFDEAAAMMHPDVEYVPVGGQAPVHGREAFRAWMEPSAWASQVIEPLEITVAGSRVLMHGRTRARGAGSGIEMEIETWIVLTVDDELLVTRIETFFPHEEAQARQAAGAGAP